MTVSSYFIRLFRKCSLALDSLRPSLRLRRIDRRLISKSTKEVILFSVMRNEVAVLPEFLAHYRKLGVAIFFIVDNGSTDGTLEYLAAQSDVRLFSCRGSYARARCGHLWLTRLLRRYGKSQWCVVADADEHLVFPSFESVSLAELATYLETQNCNALFAILLEMYSKDSLSNVRSSSLIQAYPFFDGEYRTNGKSGFGFHGMRVVGGPTWRLFGLSICLNKIPFFRYERGMILHQGAHFIDNARVAPMYGALLHFKFTSEFFIKADRERERKEHWDGASIYHRYASTIGDRNSFTPYTASSRKWTGSVSLEIAGLSRIPVSYADFLRNRLPHSKSTA